MTKSEITSEIAFHAGMDFYSNHSNLEAQLMRIDSDIAEGIMTQEDWDIAETLIVAMENEEDLSN